MLKKKFKKIIVIGGTGFIGKNLCESFKKKKINFISLGTKNCNLLKNSSLNSLKKNIHNNDIVVFVSAIAPCKDLNQLTSNLKMLTPLLEVAKIRKFSKLIYISSDAVYEDSKKKINERSVAKPNSIHGLMHKTREDILKLFFKKNLTIIRPTLVYGCLDTHNGYGPNSFARNALKNKNIKIFGNGEEIRDHVLVDDVSELINKTIDKNYSGIFNAVSASPISFLNLGKLIIREFKSKSKIFKIKRNGPMPHNGYRCFDRKKIKKLFPNFSSVHYSLGIKELKNIKLFK